MTPTGENRETGGSGHRLYHYHSLVLNTHRERERKRRGRNLVLTDVKRGFSDPCEDGLFSSDGHVLLFVS